MSHLQIFCPVTHWFVAARMSSGCTREALWWEFEPRTMVHLDVGALEQTHAGIVVSSKDIVKGSAKGFSILVERDLRARALPQSLQVLLHAVLLLIVEMRLEFDQRLVLERGGKVVGVLLLRQLNETTNHIALGEPGAIAFPTAVMELGSLSASHTVSKLVKTKRRLERYLSSRGQIEEGVKFQEEDLPEGLHSFEPIQPSLRHLRASQPPWKKYIGLQLLTLAC